MTVAKKKSKMVNQIDAYFTAEGFLIEDIDQDRIGDQRDLLKWYEEFENDKYYSLFQLGF